MFGLFSVAINCPACFSSIIWRRIIRVSVNHFSNASLSLVSIALVKKSKSLRKLPKSSSTASRLCRNTSRHMMGSEAAIRVKSRKPPAEKRMTSLLSQTLLGLFSAVLSSSIFSNSFSKLRAVPTMVYAIRCGKWLVMASTLSCRFADIISTIAPKFSKTLSAFAVVNLAFVHQG